MRFLITFSFPTESGNKKIADPEFGSKFKTLLKEIGAEAAYLCPVGGKRGGYVIVNFNDPSMIAGISEKFWHFLNADLEITPVMIPEDLAKAMTELKTTISKFG
jgi:hypothetical protein